MATTISDSPMLAFCASCALGSDRTEKGRSSFNVMQVTKSKPLISPCSDCGRKTGCGQWYVLITTKPLQVPSLVRQHAELKLTYEPPAPHLVGVELNPGPPKQHNKVNNPKRNSKQTKNPSSASASSSMSSAPVAMARKSRVNREPIITSLPNGGTRIRHREYLFDLNLGYTNNDPNGASNTGFVASSVPLNPGLKSSFPWLAGRAAGYEKYVWNMVKLQVETEAPSSTGGSIMLLFDPNAADSAPASKRAALQLSAKQRCAPWQETELNVPRAMLSSRQNDAHYIRTGSLAANLDIKTYDVGNAYFCSQSPNQLADCGEFYLDYDVTLLNPQEPPLNPSSFKVTSSTGLSSTNLFGTTNTVTSNNLPGYFAQLNAANDTFVFTSDYQGLFTFGLTGTVITDNLALQAIGANPATIDIESSTVTAAATSGTITGIITAVAGQQISPGITATTVTAVTWRFGEYLYSLG